MNAKYRKHAVALAVAAAVATPAAFAQDVNAEANLLLNAEANLLLNAEANLRYDHDQRHRVRTNTDLGEVNHSTTIREDVVRTENSNADVRREVNEHEVGVSLRKDLSPSSDIAFTGAPTIGVTFRSIRPPSR